MSAGFICTEADKTFAALRDLGAVVPTHQSVCAWWNDTYPSLRCYCIGCRAVVLFTAAAAPLGDTK